MLLDAAILLAIAATAVLMWWPRLRTHETWRAMVTPLASIIGSGFLVLGPVLDHAYGVWAPGAMFALCAVAWGFGAAIRYNIHWYGASAKRAQDRAHAGEALASALLGFAYIVSVAYYLNLLGAFALSLTPWDTTANARLLTSAVYLTILVVGWRKGFHSLETMEYVSVALKLAIIAGLLVAVGSYTTGKALDGALDFNPPQVSGLAALTLGFGLIVTVQGFETSRYLGGSYGPGVRIASMKLAQLIATAIYLAYIALIAYSFAPGEVALSETAIVGMMGLVSPILPAFLVAAALAAQFSAAVADTGGSGGLISELSRNRVAPRHAYAVTVGIGLAITWSADVFQIIAYASRAFAAYYAVQSALAAWRARTDAPARAGVFAVMAVLALAIAIFGKPVE